MDLLLALLLISGLMLTLTGLVRMADSFCEELSSKARRFRDEIWAVSECERMVQSTPTRSDIGHDLIPTGDYLSEAIDIFLQSWAVKFSEPNKTGIDLEMRIVRFPDRTLFGVQRDSVGNVMILGEIPTERRWSG